ncbi:TOBE domain-containing protein [Agromyces aerolatus]|uniref:TOBE domain-containing protein n=1 Tax=Agromyces sp. LY-1074 TaxID=3074080 RepID=UPI0028652230|nr:MULTISPECIES: TOBE domain-containing protein [unclassified Agromyces]MDR5698202.1 TOBE domain-containing protein [Agromyces sp. LY-1074]MDR5704496.1 TOBE domain-containing protein [Agromyces sp. LY-1358]
MPQHRVSEVARLLGVSDDTVRRWIDAGALAATRDEHGRLVVEGADAARRAVELAEAADDLSDVARSARNRFVGLVTRVQRDGVMAQVDIQAGPHRVVSLMSAEALDDLALEVGSLAVAVVKATTVIVETPGGRR